MKRIILLFIFLTTAISFAQQRGAINGNILDLESNSEPLMFAEVVIKETGVKTTSNENGVFSFNNLKDGNYTLVYNFVGYNTKTEIIKVVSGKTTTVKASLGASSISLDELMTTLASTDKNDTSSSSN